MSCYNLAILLKNTNRRKASKKLFREALAISERYPHLSEQAERFRQVLKDYF